LFHRFSDSLPGVQADNSNNETGFKIERSLSGGASGWTQIATVGANVTSYVDNSVCASADSLDHGLAFVTWSGERGVASPPGGSSYYYRVRAYNAGGNSNYSNTASASISCYGDANYQDSPSTGGGKVNFKLHAPARLLAASLVESGSHLPAVSAPVRGLHGSGSYKPAASPTPPAGITWRSYYYAGSTRVAMREQTISTNVVYYLHADQLGSASLATCGNAAGCGGVANGAAIPNSATRYYPYHRFVNHLFLAV
jgi:hypothetical protein